MTHDHLSKKNTALKRPIQMLARSFFCALTVLGCSMGVLASEHRPVLSSDGKQLIVMSQVNEDWELFLLTPDTGAVKRLTTHQGWDGYAVWSPSGKQIAFDRGDPENENQKTPTLMDLETGDVQPLGIFDGWLSINDWHKGGLLAFWETGGQRDLFVLSANGQIKQQLTSTPDISEHDAHFSPDGLQIVFATYTNNSEAGTSLEIMDLASGERRVIHSSGGRIYGIDWSPTGDRIAFTDSPKGADDDADVFVYNLGDETVNQCIENDAWDHMPVWSGDGRSIIFSSYRSGKERLYWTNCSTNVLPLWNGQLTGDTPAAQD